MNTYIVTREEIAASPLKPLGLRDITIAEIIARDKAEREGVVQRDQCIVPRVASTLAGNYAIRIA